MYGHLHEKPTEIWTPQLYKAYPLEKRWIVGFIWYFVMEKQAVEIISGYGMGSFWS